MLRKLSLFAIAFIALAAAAPALAQTQTVAGLKFTFDTKAVSAPAPEFKLQPMKFAGAPAPAARRQGTMSFRPVVMGGLNLNEGFGFAAGGGVQAANLAGREEFGLQIDGFWSNAGSNFCDDDDFFDIDCSASQIAIAGSFLYWFNEMTSGWRPFAGGGIVWSRFSYDVDFEGEDDIFDDIFDFDDSVSDVGLQIQGGIAKGNLQLEGRVHAVSGGAFMLLVGYRFGGGN